MFIVCMMIMSLSCVSATHFALLCSGPPSFLPKLASRLCSHYGIRSDITICRLHQPKFMFERDIFQCSDQEF